MRTSRRGFLKAASAAPAIGLAQPTGRALSIRDSSFDPWVEVDAASPRHNVDQIHRRAARPILAVIKNNGYGAGVTNVAHVLEPVLSKNSIDRKLPLFRGRVRFTSGGPGRQ